MEQENELGAKSKEVIDSETKHLPSKSDEEKSEHMKEAAMEHKIESVQKIGEAGKLKAALAPSIQDDEKSKELEKALKSNELTKAMSEQGNELGSKNEEKDEEAGKPKTAFTPSEKLKKLRRSKKMNWEPKVRK